MIADAAKKIICTTATKLLLEPSFMGMKDDILNKLTIPSPCSKDWNEMDGNNKVRSCDLCEKNVYDLSAVSRKKAIKLLNDSGGNICVRIEKTTTGEIINRPDITPKLFNITRQAAFAAGVIAASLTLASTSFSQGGPDFTKRSGSTQISKTVEQKITVSGSVKDQFGGNVSTITIHLLHEQSGTTFTTTSDHSGKFMFENIPSGKYIVNTSSNNTHIGNKMEFIFDGDTEIDLASEVMTSFVTGDVSYASEFQLNSISQAQIIQFDPENKQPASQLKTIVRGRLFDKYNNIIVGAKITLLSKQDGTIYTAVSDNSGNYIIENIVPGKYEISSKFKDQTSYGPRSIELIAGKTTVNDMKLEYIVEVGLVGFEPKLAISNDEAAQRPSTQIEHRPLNKKP